MDRREFLSTAGIGAAAITCSYCFGGCKTDNGVTGPPTNVDFTLDLTNASYTALKTVGGYLYNGGVIVARITNGSYVAVSQTCTHAGATVVYDVANNVFYCSAHGSIFGTDGSVMRGPAGSPLMRYTTSLNGNLLRVHS
jgi:cytochrome b6-f complex iron-sulfur subunit